MTVLRLHDDNIAALRVAQEIDGNPDNEPLEDRRAYRCITPRRARPQVFVTRNGRWATAQVSEDGQYILVPLMRGLPHDDGSAPTQVQGPHEMTDAELLQQVRLARHGAARYNLRALQRQFAGRYPELARFAPLGS